MSFQAQEKREEQLEEVIKRIKEHEEYVAEVWLTGLKSASAILFS